VAFLFRVGVLFHNEYPPSSDIGFHSSIINLILDDGKLPLRNPYHMGGEPLATPPGYHLFASFIIFFTGMPLLIAQLFISAFFSSLAVFPTYLISKKIWRSNSAGFLATFFVTVSSLSLEMLGWGGYPNVISLTLILIIFYLFLKNTDHPHNFNLFTTALLFGSLILTHLFSLFVLFPIIILYVSLLLLGKASKLAGTNSLNAIRFFFTSMALGTLFASPWLLRVSGFYLDMFSEGAFWGGMQENRNLILMNRYVDIRILALIGAVFPTLFMLKASRRRYLDSESLLLIAWYVVPLILTQAYIFGIFVDYSRFIYFADFPGILILSAALFYLFRHVSIATKKFSAARWNRSGKTLSQIALPAILLSVYLISPSLITPMEALTKFDFYTSVKKPEANAMEWIQQRTANSAILVSDHLYGWWLSGVAQRSTLSAVSPEFLLYPHEVDIAESALILLDTNYYIDNGLIQVREDGGYLARHNPIFIMNREQQIPYSLFHFNDDETTIFFRRKEIDQAFDVSDVETFETNLNVSSENFAVLSIIRENVFLRVNKTLTVRRGVRFAELSYEVESTDGETTINWVRFILHLRKGKILINQQIMSLFDDYAAVVGQIIFKELFPETKIYTQEDPSSVEFLYSTSNATSVKIRLLVGIFDVKDLKYEEILGMLDDIPEDPMNTLGNSSIVVSSYLEIIERYNVSFIVCRDQEIYSKFSDDPKFQLVYNSVHVAIFQVDK
jgi:hypothetical protein